MNPKTIRFYEETGLLPAPRRDAAGYRRYGHTHRDRLRFIVKAKSVGLTLREIGEILALRDGGTESCAHVRQLVDRKLAADELALLYTQPGCAESARVRAWLRERGIPFAERDVADNPEAAMALVATGVFATPLLVEGDERVPGFRPPELARLTTGRREGETNDPSR